MISHYHKHRITSADANSPQEWAAIIIERVQQPWLRGWCASIIAWDLEFKDSADLEALIDGYGKEEAFACPTPSLLAALETIGYAHADQRCFIGSTVDHCENKPKGVRAIVDRTWSKGKTALARRNACHG